MALPLLIWAPRTKPDRSAAEIVKYKLIRHAGIIGGTRLERY
jgi:hypothetical protein